jgi:hypothetical protein
MTIFKNRIISAMLIEEKTVVSQGPFLVRQLGWVGSGRLLTKM